jgi:AcrR family transcriptional regulator
LKLLGPQVAVWYGQPPRGGAVARPIRNLNSGYGCYDTELTFRLSSPTFDPVPPVTEKPLRADARRNREKVLKAARAVFAEQGRDAQMDDVARRAKVGVGTVYRHFPTKEALLEALSEEQFDVIAAYALEALERDDAWQAFLDVMWFGGERTAGDRAFSEIVAAQGDMAKAACPGQTTLRTATAELMRRAQEAGRMRPDVIIDDIPLLMCGLGSASGMPHPCSDAWRRHLGVLLDGLRAETASSTLAC